MHRQRCSGRFRLMTHCSHSRSRGWAPAEARCGAMHRQRCSGRFRL